MLFRPYFSFFCLQSEIKIISTTVFVDPYEEADAQVWISLCVYLHTWTTLKRTTENVLNWDLRTERRETFTLLQMNVKTASAHTSFYTAKPTHSSEVTLSNTFLSGGWAMMHFKMKYIVKTKQLYHTDAKNSLIPILPSWICWLIFQHCPQWRKMLINSTLTPQSMKVSTL